VKHVEACRCGASLTVEDDQRADVLAAVELWRATHPCLLPGQPAPGEKNPAGATCGVVGFSPQWDFDTGGLGRVKM
jgi:hypothetical protein